MVEDSLNQSIDNTLKSEEGVIIEQSPLTLDLKDTEIVETTDQWYKDSRKFFTDKYNLYDKRKRNETYLFGRQIDNKEKNQELKPYEVRFLDNVIYEIEGTLKALAISRLPDVIVSPGNDTEESRKVAEDVTKCVDTDCKKRENRQVLGLAFKHLPVYYTAVIKARWNPEIKDVVFEVVHPDYINFDHTCNTKNADDMKWIAQTLPLSVQECIMRFPGKRQELFPELIKDGIDVGTDEKPKTKGLLSEIKIREIWFDWYKKKPSKETEGKEPKEEWEKISCVMWKYKDVVLKKIKNPNFDYEGETKYFSMDPTNNAKKEIKPDEMQQIAMLSMQSGVMPEGITSEQMFRNYFDTPRKPFFFMGYDQWGKVAIDETSRLEQNIRNQENLDKRGKSITQKLMARVKHIFSKDGGLKKEDIEQMDLDDDRQDILIDGNVNDVHASIIPEQPTSQEFKDLDDTRTRMYAVSHSTAIRGQMQSDVATTNQIGREGDFTANDDLVNDTVTDAFEWMSQNSLHFIKLRYTEDHFKKLSGARGKMTFIKLNRDLIEDGMEVGIKASGTDKLKTEKTAMEMAGMKMIDPLNFYRDMGLSNPEGRTEDLMMFTADPASYMAKVKGLGSTALELSNSLNGEGNIPTQQPNQGIASPVVNPPVPAQGQPPLVPTSSDTTAIPPLQTGPPMGSPRGL